MYGFTTACGDLIRYHQRSMIVIFSGKRNVLSTSPLNGGYREDLSAAFNYDEKPEKGYFCQLRAATYEEHLRLVAAELELDPGRTTGISTAASMENTAIVVEADQHLSVTAITTAGVEVNGGRAGDPAAYDEQQQQLIIPGTINIILEINADLPPSAMARALITCDEAKTAALQELMAGSNYSAGLATGSGTDGVILISDPETTLYLTDTGKHSKLGELIGRAVLGAVKEALFRETGLSPDNQHSMLRRFKRYGMDAEFLWREYHRLMEEGLNFNNVLSKPEFLRHIDLLDHYDKIVVAASLYIHLLDQYQWKLLKQSEVSEAANVILNDLRQYLDVKNGIENLKLQNKNLLQEMLIAFARVIVSNIR